MCGYRAHCEEEERLRSPAIPMRDWRKWVRTHSLLLLRRVNSVGSTQGQRDTARLVIAMVFESIKEGRHIIGWYFIQ